VADDSIVIHSTVKQSFSHGRSRIVEVERIPARRPVIHLPKKKKQKVNFKPKDTAKASGIGSAKMNKKKSARSSKQVAAGRSTVIKVRKKSRTTRKSIVALVAAHVKEDATTRKEAMANALSRKSPRSRRSVFESPGAAKTGKKVRSRRGSPHRRGNPSRSYAPGLSRGMPGNEESDP
jgi:hypothetical protein